MTKFLKILTIVVALASAAGASAQEDYRFDIGAGVGMTGYLGDANSANLFQNPSWDAEVLFRYIMSPRLNLKTNFYVGAQGRFVADGERFSGRAEL